MSWISRPSPIPHGGGGQRAAPTLGNGADNDEVGHGSDRKTEGWASSTVLSPTDTRGYALGARGEGMA